MGYFFKKDNTIINVLQKILDESNRKPNKMRVNKGSEFCNISMKSWLEKKNDIEMYSPYNEKKSVPTVDLLETSRIKCIIT